MTTRLLRLFALAGSLVAGGCATWRSAAELPVRNSMVLDQLVIFSDSPLPRNHRLLQELRTLRTVVSTKLGLPISDEPIHVYLFPKADRFEAFMRQRHPDLQGQQRSGQALVESNVSGCVDIAGEFSFGDRAVPVDVGERVPHELARRDLQAKLRPPHVPPAEEGRFRTDTRADQNEHAKNNQTAGKPQEIPARRKHRHGVSPRAAPPALSPGTGRSRSRL